MLLSIRTRTRLLDSRWPSPSFCVGTRPSGPTSRTLPSLSSRMTGWRLPKAASREGEADLTRLESGMSFMQVRASMSMKEKLRQVRGAICENRRDIARTRLEAIVGRTTRTASYPSSDGATLPSRPGERCT